MYRITWQDSSTREDKSLQVHTIKSARMVADTLRLQSDRYRHVVVTYTQPRRVREIVIVFEK